MSGRNSAAAPIGRIGALAVAFGVSAAGDMNGDGVTDGADLGAFLAVFGQPCP